jgi:diguanylate cyclase (GGDEF)-like protein/PAS domain S-box-containing protein
MSNLTSSISTKIAAAFGVMFLVVLALGGLSLDRVGAINDLAIATRDDWLPSTQTLGQLRATVRLYRLAEARVALAQRAPDIAAYAAQMHEAAVTVERARAACEPLIAKGTDAARLLRAFDAAWSNYRSTSSRLVDDVATGAKADQRTDYLGEDATFYEASAAAVTGAIDFNARSGIVAANKGPQIYRQTRELVIGAMGIAAAVSVMLGVALFRSVSTPMKRLTAAMKRLAAGDLTVAIPGVRRKDELGAMAEGLDIFKASLIETAQLRARQDEQNAALRASEERFRAVFTFVNDGIFVSDSITGEYVDVNQPGCELIGYQREEILGRDLGMLSSGIAPYTRDAAMQWLAKARTNGPQVVEWHCKAKDGHLFWAEISIRLAAFGARHVVLATVRDISDRKKAEAQILQMARRDGLTDLPNRGVFVDAVTQAIARARRDTHIFAVLYLDLDHFKDVNDTLGHPIGDELLRAVAARLRAAVRETDLVARFGGDEFAVMAADIREAADAAALGDKLVTALCNRFSIRGNDIYIGVSIGIAVYGREAPDVETLLSQADVALYRAKSDGRGTYRFFTDAMDTETRARVTLVAELREAISCGQLFLMYQPQVEIQTGRITGLEAQVRWRHPQRGVLGPEAFIREAEDSGLMLALGHWVLREACRQGKTWLDAGTLPATIAVNLSAAELKKPLELEQFVATTLADTGLPPGRLEVELKDTVLMEAYRSHHDVLARLRKSGIRFAIDDFGTGPASFDYLLRYPADRIKIAQSFVRHLETTPGNVAVVKAILGLAHDLGMAVIADGIETQRQLEMLTAWGCCEAQGCDFAQPLTPQDLAPLLHTGAIVRPQWAATNGTVAALIHA